MNKIHTNGGENLINKNALKNAIGKSGVSVTFLAEKMGISREGLYKKINGETEFKASEIFDLQKTLHLTNAKRDAIFFATKRE